MAARKQYPLRIDPAIWEAVELWAKDEMRSGYCFRAAMSAYPRHRDLLLIERAGVEDGLRL